MCKYIKSYKLYLLTLIISILIDILVVNKTTFYFIRDLTFEAGLLKALVFVFIWVALHFSIVYCIHHRIIRFAAIPLFGLFVGINLAYQKIQGAPFGFADLETAVISYKFAWEAISAFKLEIIIAIMFGVLFVVITTILSFSCVAKTSKYKSILALIGVMLGGLLALRTNGSHIRAFPSAISPVYTILYNFYIRIYMLGQEKFRSWLLKKNLLPIILF